MEKNNFEFTPCRNCTIKEDYGGDYRCSACEVNWLRKENERLNGDRAVIKSKQKQKIEKQAIREFAEKFLHLYMSSDGAGKDAVTLMVELLDKVLGEQK